MAKAFDDFRRSTASLCLVLMRQYDLPTDEEVREFSDSMQRTLEQVNKGWGIQHERWNPALHCSRPSLPVQSATGRCG
ncbi:MAG TPA: hypothetical protein VK973_17120 [Arenicellales bacterium]|nr:hypothetical protein [Arenicellales bacterium]